MATKVTLNPSTIALLITTLRTLESKITASEERREAKMLPVWLPNGEYITELKDLAAVLCLDERTAAFVVLDSCNPPPGLLAEAKRKVKTPAGALWYGQGIGEEIRRDRRSWASRIMESALAGGMTLSLLSGAEPKAGYVVAERGTNTEIPAEVFFDKPKGMAELRKWATAHADKFDDPAAHLGIWYDTEHDEVCLDVSYVLDDRDEAVARGQQNNQQAIWDIANMDEIGTFGTGDRHGGTGGTGDRQEKSRVRTPAGAERYGQNIGEVIRRDVPRWASRTLAAIMAGSIALTFLGSEQADGLSFDPHTEQTTISQVDFSHRGRGLSAMRDHVTKNAAVFDNPAAHLSIYFDDKKHEVVMDVPFVLSSDEEPPVEHRHIWLSDSPDDTDLGERTSQSKGHDNGQGLHRKAAEAGQSDDTGGNRRMVGNGLGRDASRFDGAGKPVKSGIIRHRGARVRADQKAVINGQQH